MSAISDTTLPTLRGHIMVAVNSGREAEANRLRAEIGVIRAAQALDSYPMLDADQAARLKAYVDERTQR